MLGRLGLVVVAPPLVAGKRVTSQLVTHYTVGTGEAVGS
jgi:hypothetical protein